MKIIDLLNKIANGEEVPEKIIVNGIYFKYDGELTYTNKDFFSKETYLFSDDYDWGRWINDEVEIIEEKETKPSEEEIEAFKEQFNTVWNSIKSVLGGILEALIKIDEKEITEKVLEKENNKIEYVGKEYNLTSLWGKYPETAELLKDLCNKVKELIDVINELRGENDEK